MLFLILVRSNQSDQQYYSPLYSEYLFYWEQHKGVGKGLLSSGVHVHFFNVRRTTTKWNLPMRHFVMFFWRTETYDDEFSFFFLNLDKVVKIPRPTSVN